MVPVAVLASGSALSPAKPLAFREAKLVQRISKKCHIIYLNTCKSRAFLHTLTDREILSLTVM